MITEMQTIDLHTHGAGGYDTRTTEPEHILKIARLHGSRGVSAIIPTIYSATVKVMREQMEVVKEAMRLQSGSNVEDTDEDGAVPAKILGVHLEGPFLNPVKAGALNAITFINASEYAFQELTDGFEDIVKIMTVAPEIENSRTLIKKISDAGIKVNMGHSDATYQEAERGYNAGAKGITHLFNAMRGFQHREPGLAGFGLLHNDIYIELIADPYHLHAATLDLVFRVKNHDRIIVVSDSVRETLTWLRGELSDSRGTLIGGSMAVTDAAKRLVDEGFEADTINACVSDNPLRYLDLR
ncbi:MAG: hypothetical protein EPN22_12440 [Nitrospirae bacterium]|nr:MAG: hypothetical protein EPN22_12440 [Nitrospirota bacterium]